MAVRLDSLKQLIATARGNKFSSLRNIDDDAVYNVWDMVSQWIEFNMQRSKAVNISGLGCFTFTSKEMNIDYKRYIVVHRPVFILSEKLVGVHRLNQPKYLVPGEIPVTQLNLIALASELEMTRDVVEASLKEIIQAFSRRIEKHGNAELAFTTIGNLVVKTNQSKMKFQPSFLDKMDHTGSLVRYFANRPDTSDSMLDNDQDRPATHPVVLPKIEPGVDLELARNDTDGRNCIAFNESKTDLYAEERVPAPPQTPRGQPTDVPSSPRRERDQVIPKANTIEPASIPDAQNAKVSTPRTSLRGRCGGVLFKDPRNSPSQGAQRIDSTVRLSPPIQPITSQAELDKHRLSKSEKSDRNASKTSEAVSKSVDTAVEVSRLSPLRVKTRRLSLQEQNPSSSQNSEPARVRSEGSQRQPAAATKTTDKSLCENCLTKNTDFCYLCFQREKRNVPVYFTKQRNEKEQEEDRLLQMYQHLKDSESLSQERDCKSKKRECSQKMAAFNLGVAEAIKSSNSERPVDYNPSFVFYKRAVTPPWVGIEKSLREQVMEKKAVTEKEKRDQGLLERMEQLHLSQDLALQRQHYLERKKQMSEEYRKALDTQMNFRTPQLPAAEPDSDNPIFGIHDSTPEKLAKGEQRARDLYESQRTMAVEKENRVVEEARKKQQEEVQMLKKTKKELMAECCCRNERNLTQRVRLEESWKKNATMKRQREQEEDERTKSPGLLLLEQCEDYKRCAQCCRHANNCGESNVWSESRYVAGSRLIV